MKIACSIVFALLLAVFVAPGAQAGDEGRAHSVMPDQAASCRACGVALERCSANCSGLEGKEEIVACQIGCDNAAATCSCDEKVTLRSEDLVEDSFWVGTATTCQSTTPCGPDYPSCASWSTYSNCDAPFCGIQKGCAEECETEFGCFGPATRQLRQRFRVCFNALGQSCTEYQRTNISLGCGC